MAENADYNAAFSTAVNAGVDFINLHHIWGNSGRTNLPLTPLVNNADGTSFDDTLLDIANAYYPAQGMKVSMTIGTIDTNNTFVPSGLVGTAFDNQVMIERFNALLDNVFAHIPNLELVALQLGNEVDVTLGTDAAAWARYQAFFSAVAAHARTLRPGLRVGVTMTMYGALNPAITPYAQSLANVGDHFSFTYYPMNSDFTQKSPSVVTGDVDALVAAFPGKEIFLNEAGYASGSMYVASSVEQQRMFVGNVFSSWDAHASRIRAISFLNLHEWPQSTVDGFGAQYGLCPSTLCEPFKEYLRTLGLRTFAGSGSDKPAFVELRTQAQARGWNVQ